MKSKIFKQIVFLMLVIIIWQVLIIFKIWPRYIFPSPEDVIITLMGGFKDLTIPIAVGISMKRIIIGYGIAIVIGGLLGLLLTKFKIVEETIGGLVLGIQTLPSVCWLPLSILWFGLNEKAIIFVVVMGALFSITLSVEAGIKNVPPLFIKAGKNMGAKNIRLFMSVILPSAMPAIITGLKQGWSFAWRSLMAGELLFVSLGLGHLLMMGRELNDMSQVLGVMMLITVISMLMDKLIFGQLQLNINRKWGFLNKP